MVGIEGSAHWRDQQVDVYFRHNANEERYLFSIFPLEDEDFINARRLINSQREDLSVFFHPI